MVSITQHHDRHLVEYWISDLQTVYAAQRECKVHEVQANLQGLDLVVGPSQWTLSTLAYTQVMESSLLPNLHLTPHAATSGLDDGAKVGMYWLLASISI